MASSGGRGTGSGDQAEVLKAKFQDKFASTNGRISTEVLRRLLRVGLSDPEIDVLVQQCQISKDGSVDCNELLESIFGDGRAAAGAGLKAAKQLRQKGSDEGSSLAALAPSALQLHRSETMSPSSAARREQSRKQASECSLSSARGFLCSEPSQRMSKSCETRTWAVPTPLDRSLVREFFELDQGGKVQVEYVWIDSEYTDGDNFDICSKSMTVDGNPQSVRDLPVWSYSGEDAGFAVEVVIVPRRIYRDPFRRGPNIIVLTDCYTSPPEGSNRDMGDPMSWNSRAACDAAMGKALADGQEPWFGIEQEYYLLDVNTSWPLGWPKGGFPGPQGAYFCANGAAKAVGRDVVEAHYRACMYAGVKIGGINSEVAPGQWEFQVGPAVGTTCADDLWMARYLLQRTCELFQVNVTFDPKPVSDWAGIGCHTNFSTKATRGPGGFDVIVEHCKRLEQRHKEHMEVYGTDNERRLVGNDETQSFYKFSWGVGDRTASIRIPVKAASTGRGYYEDRRPAANMDPYLVTRYILETTLFPEHKVSQLKEDSAGDNADKPSSADAAAGRSL